MQVVYAQQPFPESWTKAIFLAGPTPRADKAQSWRPEAIRILEAFGYDGVVLSPEDADGVWRQQYDDQVIWEEEALNRADVIVFWVPRDLETMPAFTTNQEHGEWLHSGKTVFGAPPAAPGNRYMRFKAREVGEPIAETLEDTLKIALEMIGPGAERHGGECQVPLQVWSTPAFQSWYAAQKSAGNELHGARVTWLYRTSQDRPPFLWALHADIHVGKEDRHKTNEIILARPDVSSVLLYRRQGADPLDTKVVLVREFRSPVANADGFVHELPGGSSFQEGASPKEIAAEEVLEETGFRINHQRLVQHGTRQVAATLVSYRAHLFSAELTEAELDRLAEDNQPHGVVEDSERTYVEIRTLREILASQLVDWNTLGMILSVLPV